jgi:hypothetical protein
MPPPVNVSIKINELRKKRLGECIVILSENKSVDLVIETRVYQTVDSGVMMFASFSY